MYRVAAYGTGLALLAVCWLLRAADPPPEEYQVPYRLTDTKHILVRARINGKGPFRFIVDTGSPALFVSTALGRKLGITADKDGWAVFPRFEVEGGIVLNQVKGRLDDPYQLEGMNKSGVAGVELHGILGYNVLARFRLTIDLSKDKMTWQPLGVEPPLPEINGKAVDAFAGVNKALTEAGPKVERGTGLRGFLGVTLGEKAGAVVVESVLEGGPAQDKLRPGDRITAVHAKPIKTVAEMHRMVAPWSEGDDVEMTVLRDGAKRSVRVRLGKGL